MVTKIKIKLCLTKKNTSKNNYKQNDKMRLVALMLIGLIIILNLSLSIKAYKNPNTVFGRNVIVHLFEWKWNE